VPHLWPKILQPVAPELGPRAKKKNKKKKKRDGEGKRGRGVLTNRGRSAGVGLRFEFCTVFILFIWVSVSVRSSLGGCKGRIVGLGLWKRRGGLFCSFFLFAFVAAILPFYSRVWCLGSRTKTAPPDDLSCLPLWPGSGQRTFPAALPSPCAPSLLGFTGHH